MPCPPAVTQRHHELQGPRPSPFNVKGDSRTVRKRRPVIIYVESPKVIHAHPSEFRSVVQSLTGAPPSSSGASPPSSMMFSSAAPLQFPFQLYGQALNDMDYCRTLPLVTSTLPPTTVAAPAPPVSLNSFSSSPPGDAAGRVFSFFSNHQIGSTASLFDQNVVPAAGPGSVQANLLVSSSDPLLPPFLGGVCQWNLFVNQ